MPILVPDDSPSSGVSLEDLKQHLNITSSNQDDELAKKLAAAEAHVAQKIGPLSPTSYLETYPCGPVIVLRRAPVVSVESVTHDSGARTYNLDATNGLLYLDWRAYGVVEVAYTAGWVSLPADVYEAVLEAAAGLWRSQRGAAPLPLQGGADDTAPDRFASVLSPRVQELLEPYLLPRSLVA